MLGWPRFTALSCAFLTVTAALFAAPRLGLNSNESAMFSPEVPYAALRREFARAFPALLDPLIVIVEADHRDAADALAERLLERVAADPTHFPHVFDPAAQRFFETRGLLYLSTTELEDTLDRLINAQPFLAEYAADPSLRGFATLLTRALDAEENLGPETLEGLDTWVAALATSTESLVAERPRPLDTRALFGSESPSESTRRFLLIQAAVDHTQLDPAKETLAALREILDEVQAPGVGDAHAGATGPEVGDARAGVAGPGWGDARARVTGLYALASEEAHLVEAQARLAGLASLALVSLLLIVGLGATRVVLWILLTLVAGLVGCAAFAAAAIGHLNLVSVAFGVLFIGLSVDSGIHFVLRAQELRAGGADASTAVVECGRSVGASLAICAATTALAFFAFVPSAFLGVAELGLIAGVGMLISLFLNLTLLPALLVWGGVPLAPRRVRSTPDPTRLPWRRPWAAIATLAAALAALPLLPTLHFDTNPLRVRDPAAESVQAFDTLLAHGEAFPWNLNVLADDAESAERIARELRSEVAVDQALWLGDFVPEEQEEKLALLEDASFVMGPALALAGDVYVGDGEDRGALNALRDRTRNGRPAAQRLSLALATLLEDGPDRLRALRGLWVHPMNRDLSLMRGLLQPGRIEMASLPDEIRAQRVARDGRYRVEVFPREDLGEAAALERFVLAVQGVDPNAFGEGMVIYESGKIVVDAFQGALLMAGLGVLLLLALLWRNRVDTALVAIPIGLAALLSAAGTQLLGIPLNWANVIVIPLLVGMGVDSGIHMVQRLRYEDAAVSILRTSTARAVVFSALTTLASFGTLAFASHRGMASLGRLLALGIAMILLCNLCVLPALAHWWRRSEET